MAAVADDTGTRVLASVTHGLILCKVESDRPATGACDAELAVLFRGT